MTPVQIENFGSYNPVSLKSIYRCFPIRDVEFCVANESATLPHGNMQMCSLRHRSGAKTAEQSIASYYHGDLERLDYFCTNEEICGVSMPSIPHPL